ncbi:MAG: redoxin domain-containing protein [Deferrisomatales bacterium]|nr:redoxin domain-containing protein [Deferrisomatales bacterium]
MHRFTAAAVLIALCITVGHADRAAAFKRTTVGSPSRDFVLDSLEGTSLRLTENLGPRATILLFWATWNSRSLEALRDLQQLHTRFKDEGLTVIAVNVDAEGYAEGRRAAVSGVVQDLGLSYPMLIDGDLRVYDAYGVVSVPSIAVVDPKGKIAEVLPGYASTVRSEFHEKVLTALAMGTPSPEDRAPRVGTNGSRGAARRFLELGYVLQRTGRIEEATRHFTRAVAQDPFYKEACQALSTALQQAGRMDEAERVLAQLDGIATR